MSCRYMRPIFLEEVLTVQLSITDLKPRGFTLHFRVLRGTEPVAEGELVRRCVSKSRQETIEMPQELFTILQEIATGGDAR